MVTNIIFDWIKEGIKLNIGATKELISSCENAIEFRFPKDFTDFYSLHNGFEDFTMDSRFLSLWPTEKIQAEFDFQDEFVAFSDFLINSHQIGFIKGLEGIYKDYDRTLICNSYTEFLYHWKNQTYEYM